MNKQRKNTTDKELEDQLIRNNYGLVVSQALSFLSKNSSLDEFIQAGLIGLLRAIRQHDEDIAKFSTYE
jgi:DNA-directed RNA polymerase specialized sigma subunit